MSVCRAPQEGWEVCISVSVVGDHYRKSYHDVVGRSCAVSTQLVWMPNLNPVMEKLGLSVLPLLHQTMLRVMLLLMYRSRGQSCLRKDIMPQWRSWQRLHEGPSGQRADWPNGQAWVNHGIIC